MGLPVTTLQLECNYFRSKVKNNYRDSFFLNSLLNVFLQEQGIQICYLASGVATLQYLVLEYTTSHPFIICEEKLTSGCILICILTTGINVWEKLHKMGSCLFKFYWKCFVDLLLHHDSKRLAVKEIVLSELLHLLHLDQNKYSFKILFTILK